MILYLMKDDVRKSFSYIKLLLTIQVSEMNFRSSRESSVCFSWILGNLFQFHIHSTSQMNQHGLSMKH
mgnify:CR=1 FL=1